MIAGIEKPDDGTIRAGGRLVFDKTTGVNIPPENRGLGMVIALLRIEQPVRGRDD